MRSKIRQTQLTLNVLLIISYHLHYHLFIHIALSCLCIFSVTYLHSNCDVFLLTNIYFKQFIGCSYYNGNSPCCCQYIARSLQKSLLLEISPQKWLWVRAKSLTNSPAEYKCFHLLLTIHNSTNTLIQDHLSATLHFQALRISTSL